MVVTELLKETYQLTDSLQQAVYSNLSPFLTGSRN